MTTTAANVENSVEYPAKIKMELPFNPAIPLLGMHPKNHKTPILKNVYMNPCIYSSTIYNRQDWKQHKCPSVDE